MEPELELGGAVRVVRPIWFIGTAHPQSEQIEEVYNCWQVHEKQMVCKWEMISVVGNRAVAQVLRGKASVHHFPGTPFVIVLI